MRAAADDDSESDGDAVFDELGVGEEDIGMVKECFCEFGAEGFSGCIRSRYRYATCCVVL